MFVCHEGIKPKFPPLRRAAPFRISFDGSLPRTAVAFAVLYTSRNRTLLLTGTVASAKPPPTFPSDRPLRFLARVASRGEFPQRFGPSLKCPL
ncbi:uncharacterized protein J3R85_018767 [Psidium guajava]|nr:uncharacterized protein J3R85_018767 [Psidium guajava]